MSISFCSKPGCGYPDGKPCIGCGAVVPKGIPVLIHCEDDFSMMLARLIRALRHGNPAAVSEIQEKAETLLCRKGRMSPLRMDPTP